MCFYNALPCPLRKSSVHLTIQSKDSAKIWCNSTLCGYVLDKYWIVSRKVKKRKAMPRSTKQNKCGEQTAWWLLKKKKGTSGRVRSSFKFCCWHSSTWWLWTNIQMHLWYHSGKLLLFKKKIKTHDGLKPSTNTSIIRTDYFLAKYLIAINVAMNIEQIGSATIQPK